MSKILLDLDDVVAEYVPTLTKFYNKVYRQKVTPESIKTWQLKDHYEHTSTEEEVRALMTLFAHSKDFRKMPAVPGAVEGIKLLQQDNDVSILTARASRSIDATYDWLHEKGLGDIPVYFNKDKGKMAYRLSADVVVDDGVHNLDRVLSYRQEVNQRPLLKQPRTIVYDKPWNKLFVNYAHERIRDWPQLLKELRE